MKGCPHCGTGASGLKVCDGGSCTLPAVACTACGAVGPWAGSAAQAELDWDRRPREREAWATGLSLGLAVGALLAAVILGVCANRVRQDLVTELEDAWALTAAVEDRAWVRGLQAGRQEALAGLTTDVDLPWAWTAERERSYGAEDR